MSEKVLLACDIAYAHFGWVVMKGDSPVACGVIESEKDSDIKVSKDYFNRSIKIVSELEKIIKTYEIKAILGEMPTGGAKSSRAAIQMQMASAIMACICHLLDLPREFCSPNDVKIITTGKLTATKSEIMDFIIDRFGGKKTTKMVNCKATVKNPTGRREEHVYHFLGQKLGVGRFEHVADALGAWLYLKVNGNLIKLMAL
ncbi:MAG: hypothetical protein JEZ11_17900 [Desulfobacterales bacterium]|nr:hypothetical protein [Desulfobacterales bacterium]